MILEVISSASDSASSSAMDSVGEAISSIGTQLPTEAQPITDWASKAWQWMNEPLPIVGFSLIAVIIFLWRFLTATSIGKKALKKLRGEFEETKETTKKTLDERRVERGLFRFPQQTSQGSGQSA